jgi:hypothetical protein
MKHFAKGGMLHQPAPSLITDVDRLVARRAYDLFCARGVFSRS